MDSIALYLMEKYLLKRRMVMDREQKVGFLSSRDTEIWCFAGPVSLAQNQMGKEKSIYPCLSLWWLTYATKTDNKRGWRRPHYPASATQMHFWSLELVCVQPHLKPHKWWVNSDDESLGCGHCFFLMSSTFPQRKSFASAG